MYLLLFFEERIAKGEDAVLTKEKTSKLAVTSGTTGPSCMIPRVPSQEYPNFLAASALYNKMYEVYPEVRINVYLLFNTLWHCPNMVMGCILYIFFIYFLFLLFCMTPKAAEL